MGASRGLKQTQKLMFDLHEEKEVVEQKALADVFDRPWMKNKKNEIWQPSEIVGVDFGRGKMSCYFLRAEKTPRAVPNREAIDFLVKDTPPGCLIVTEAAHMATPRTNKSLAQPFTQEELIYAAEAIAASGRRLMLFPQSMTRRVAAVVENMSPEFVTKNKSSDINDAKIIAYYVGNVNGISLMNPVTCFDVSDKSRFGRLVRRSSNRVLNPARNLQYSSAVGDLFPKTYEIACELFTSLKYTVPLLGETLSTAIGFASMVMFENSAAGEFAAGHPASVFVYKGNFPGWRFFKEEVVMMSPCHHRGGIFRSNIYCHRLRTMVRQRLAEEGEEFTGGKRISWAELTPEQDRIRRKVAFDLREDVRTAYKAALAICVSQGLPRLELLEAGDLTGAFA